MTKIIPIASGKGGTGKSLFALNFSIALSLRRKTVVLIDFDLGGSNLHTLFGIESRKPGIGDIIFKNESSFNALLQETSIKRLFFIKGDSRYPATAHLNYQTKEKIKSEIKKLIADYVVIDLGAGSFLNIIDFFLVSNNGILVVTPEVTSILNAYSFLKTTLYRLLYRSFPGKSRERDAIFSYMKSLNTKTKSSFAELSAILGEVNKASGNGALETLHRMKPGLVLNMAQNKEGLDVGKKLADICKGNLDVSLDFMGALPKSQEVGLSIASRKPVFILDPVCRFSESIDSIAKKVIADELIDRLSSV